MCKIEQNIHNCVECAKRCDTGDLAYWLLLTDLRGVIKKKNGEKAVSLTAFSHFFLTPSLSLSAIASKPGHLGHSVLHILHNCEYFVQFCTFYTIDSELCILCTILDILKILNFLESYAYFAQLCILWTALHILQTFADFAQS